MVKRSKEVMAEEPKENIIFNFNAGVDNSETFETKRAKITITGFEPAQVEKLREIASKPNGEPFIMLPLASVPTVASTFGIAVDALTVEGKGEGVLVKNGALRLQVEEKGIKVVFINK